RAARRTPGLRDRDHDELEPRLAEPGRDGARPTGRAPDDSRGRRARRGVDPVRAWAGRPRAPAPGERRRPRRIRRAREGALAAVPDLAHPCRPARPRPARADRLGAARARAPPHAALVPVPLLGAGPRIRGVSVVARPRPRRSVAPALG